MIDITGIISMGFANNDINSNGIFLFKDGSFAFGYKIGGFAYLTMSNEEKILIYQKIRNILNQLDDYYKSEGAIYQFISKKNYSFEEEKKRIAKNNFILYDPKYKNEDTDEVVKPYFLDQVIKKNNEEFFNIIDELGLHKYDNYIFVKYKINFSKLEGVTLLDILKNIFIRDRNDREIQEANEFINNVIHSHNSRLSEIGAEPLTLLEMINVFREHLGFSKLTSLPSTKNEDSYLKYLFPGKISYERDYIKTEEKVFVSENTKFEISQEEKEVMEKIEYIISKDENNILNPSNETINIENDLYLILSDILKLDINYIKSLTLRDKYEIFKNSIEFILKKINNIHLNNFSYFDLNHLKVYKYKKDLEQKNPINNETYIKIFSVNDLPENLKIGSGMNFHALEGDYSIVINFKKINKEEAQIKMRRQVVIENIKISMPIMKWFMPIEVIQSKIQILREISQQLEEAEFSRVDSLFYVVLRSNSIRDPREKIILGSYETETEMKWIKEKDAPDFHILKCSLPTVISNGALELSKRSFFINTTNIAQLIPFIKEEKGAKTLVLPMVGYNSIIGIDLNEASAGHFSIQGSTGGGKSVIGNKIAFNYKTLGDTIIVTEKGASFARPALFFGGKVYKPDLSGKIKINPFVMTKNAFDESIENYEEIRLQNYIQMKAALAQMCNNYDKDVQQLYFKLLKKAFENENGKLNTTYVENYSIRPTKLLKLMNLYPEFNKLQKEKKAFEQFTSKGPYGKIFDGNQGLSMDHPYIQIDYSGITESDMKDFIFKSLLQNVFFEMSKSSNNQKFLNINDEFWDIIGSGINAENGNIVGTAMEQVASFFRVARKLGGKIGVISQSINDVANSPLKDAIINNIYHTFFTNTKPSELKSIKDLFHLEDEFLNIISNLNKVNGQYSEYFVALAPYGEKLPGRSENRTLKTKFKYFPTSLEYALFTTDSTELDLFNYLYQLLGASDPREVTTKQVKKAVLFFTLFFPRGIYQNTKFLNKLYDNKNVLIAALKDYVETETGKNIKEVINQLDWEHYF